LSRQASLIWDPERTLAVVTDVARVQVPQSASLVNPTSLALIVTK
jgi:hypothetical protein